jgi:hypothetical protein
MGHPAGPEDRPQEGAVARKLAVILHRMWRDGTEFRWSNKEAAVTASVFDHNKFRRVWAESRSCQGEVTAIAGASLRL